MRKYATNVALVLLLMLVSAFVEAKSKLIIYRDHSPIVIKTTSILTTLPKIKSNTSVPIIKNHYRFLEDLGMRESSKNYKAVNRFGYLGKYQFGRKTLDALGYKHISNREFLSDPDLQEQIMEDLLVHNKKILRRYIKKYNNKTIHGVYVTESGILAAAHLAGAGNVRRFFRNGKNFADGNGTKMTSYMKQFANYKLNI
jgi:hypothetical protein